MNSEIIMRRMIEQTISNFNFGDAQKCMSVLAPKFGTVDYENVLRDRANRLFNNCLIQILEHGADHCTSTSGGFEVYLSSPENPDKDMAGICTLKFIAEVSEIWDDDLVADEEPHTKKETLKRIDQFEEQILNMVRELRQEISDR